MFNATLIVIEAFIRELRTMYERTYGTMEPGYPGVISFVAQLALENIATSDAAYHDVNHTIMVTLVGQEILRGRHISVGGVTPRDWLHFIISLLCHDIGYVRGICRGDGDGSYVTNLAGDKVTLPEGATDASMTPYHVARSQLFVRERAEKALVHLDIAAIDAVAISDKLVFSDTIVNQQRVGVAARADGERLPGSDSDDVNRDAGRRPEDRQDVAEQSRILGRGGRTKGDESRIGLCRNSGKKGQEEGNDTEHDNHL